jgi:hypothetical protein
MHCVQTLKQRTASSSAENGDAGSYAEEDNELDVEDEECWASGSHASSSDTFSEVGDPAATEVGTNTSTSTVQCSGTALLHKACTAH